MKTTKKAKAPLLECGLIGKWFHACQGLEIIWQGQVLSQVGSQWVLVQLFSWLDGCPTIQKVFPYHGMAEWNFYDTNDEMNLAWENSQQEKKRRRELCR
jgi:hypothetical protein